MCTSAGITKLVNGIAVFMILDPGPPLFVHWVFQQRSWQSLRRVVRSCVLGSGGPSPCFVGVPQRIARPVLNAHRLYCSPTCFDTLLQLGRRRECTHISQLRPVLSLAHGSRRGLSHLTSALGDRHAYLFL